MNNKKTAILGIASVLLLLSIVFVSVRLNRIEIKGSNSWYSAEQLEDLIFPTTLSRTTGIAFANQLMKKKQSIPFVEDYRINFTSFTSADVYVYEKSIVGCVEYMSSFMYFDKDGIIVESASKRLPGIPLINGLSFGEIVLYKPLPVQERGVFSNILNLTQTLSTYDISVDLIRYDRTGAAILVIGDLNVEVGDSSDMNGKISALANMLPTLEGHKGTLDLSSYDPTAEKEMYSFRYR